MGSSDSADHGEHPGGEPGGHGIAERGARARCALLSMVAPCVLLGALLLGSAPASAAGEVQHAYKRTLEGKGTKCAFTEPGGVAVSDATGEVFVYDRGAASIDAFSSTGTCIAHRHIGHAATGESAFEGIAVDNSGTSPSAGDVYVVDAEEHALLKLKPEGATLKLVAKFKTFKLLSEGKEAEVHAFEEHEVDGMAVDAHGGLWVYGGEVIDHFAPNESGGAGHPANEFLGLIETSGSCGARPGFAVAPSAEYFFVGRERESRAGSCEEPTVMVKLNAAGETFTEPPGEGASKAQLDNENTTGVALDLSSGPTGGDVYFDNATNVSAFNSGSTFLERFGNHAPNPLQEGAGIAIDSGTNEVFVADAHGGEGQVDVFTPEPVEERKPEPPPEKEPKQLADGRQWEMVSPANKFGAALFPITQERGVVQASEDGGAIVWVASGPIVANPPANRAPEATQALSKRNGTGWSTEDVMPPRSEVPEGLASGSGIEYRFFSSDLSRGLVEPQEQTPYPGPAGPHEPPLSPEQPAPETTLYWRSLTPVSETCEPVPSSCYQALVSGVNDTTGIPYGSHLGFMGATPDASYAVVKSDVKLNSEGTAEEGLYERKPDGSLQLVSVLPEAEAKAGGETAGAELGRHAPAFALDVRNAISSEGRRVVWSTEQGIYLRDMTSRETIRLDTAREGLPQPEGGALYQTASADGTKIFFTDKQPLLRTSTFQEGEEETLGLGDLYVCEVVEEGGKPACHLKDLTAEIAAAHGPAAVQGVLGASEDGSYVYFVANGILAPKVHEGNCEPREGGAVGEEREGKLPVLSCSLYVEHLSGGTWEAPKLIAELTSEDVSDWTLSETGGGLGPMTSRVSPNGQYLAFMSNRSLTGYNNVDSEPQAKGARAEEVFLYKAATDRIACASCDPSGAPPRGLFDTNESNEGGNGPFVDRPTIWQHRWISGNVPGWTGVESGHALYQSRYLSNSGRLFFNSADQLVEADKNHVEDVYQYEPAGEGSCASAGGCISLISGGAETAGPGSSEREHESAFLDASANGNDVFFLTAHPLGARDQDTAYDVYDARACLGSSSCLPPPPPPATPCTGEACRPPAASAPALPSAPPSTQPGSGNGGKVVVLNNKATVVPPKKLTRAQQLAKSLKACKKLKKKKSRVACEKQARKRYGPIKKKSTKTAPRKGKK
jgi:DNA-binding beta-propeller fold protein YncE